MTECNKYKRYFQKALNGELRKPEKELFENHLITCRNCADEYNELKSTVDVMKQHRASEPPEAFLENLWQNIEPELKKEQTGKSLPGLLDKVADFVTFKHNWIPQFSGAVALLIVGIFLGKYLFVDAPSGSEEITTMNQAVDQPTAAIMAKADNYIESSKVLLLGLTNFDPEVDDVETICLPRQQNISRRLLTDAANLKAELNKPSQANLRQLVSDLEIILLQIANLETEYDLSGIELVKQGVDRRGIFLKINIREMQRNKINSAQPLVIEEKEKNNI